MDEDCRSNNLKRITNDRRRKGKNRVLENENQFLDKKTVIDGIQRGRKRKIKNKKNFGKSNMVLRGASCRVREKCPLSREIDFMDTKSGRKKKQFESGVKDYFVKFCEKRSSMRPRFGRNK